MSVTSNIITNNLIIKTVMPPITIVIIIIIIVTTVVSKELTARVMGITSLHQASNLLKPKSFRKKETPLPASFL